MAKDAHLSPREVDAARRRRLEAMQLQAIEGNPLSAEQVAMFEMFEREAWPHARRRAHILARVIPLAAEASIASHRGDDTGMIRAIRRSIPD